MTGKNNKAVVCGSLEVFLLLSCCVFAFFVWLVGWFVGCFQGEGLLMIITIIITIKSVVDARFKLESKPWILLCRAVSQSLVTLDPNLLHVFD